MADEKKSRRSVMYDKGKKGKEGSAKEERTEPKAEAKKEGDAMPSGPSMGDKHSEARSGMMKRHEGERKDAHGNHRDNLRKMTLRHEKEIKELMAAHEAEMAGAAAAPAEGNGAPDPAAGAASAAAPAPQPA